MERFAAHELFGFHGFHGFFRKACFLIDIIGMFGRNDRCALCPFDKAHGLDIGNLVHIRPPSCLL